MKLILDTLEAARLAAPSLAEADALRIALIDLETLDAALASEGRTLEDVLPALGERQALRDHVAAQPFDAYESFDGSSTVKDLTPGAFIDWLETLERLAR